MRFVINVVLEMLSIVLEIRTDYYDMCFRKLIGVISSLSLFVCMNVNRIPP